MTATDELGRTAGTTVARAAAAGSVLLAIPATLFAVWLSVGACIGSERVGVSADSIRGQECDIPGLGPWPYPLAVAVIALVLVVRPLLRGRVTGGRTLVVAVLPSLAVFVAPLVLSMLPRRRPGRQA